MVKGCPGATSPPIVPYFAVSLAYSLLKYFVPQLAARPVVPGKLLLALLVYPAMNPALFMWFLYTIIILHVLAPFMARINRYAMFTVLLVLQVLNPDIRLFGGGLVLNYALYYYLGFTARTAEAEFLQVLEKKVLPLIALLVFLAGYLLRINTGVEILRLITALSGIAFVLSVSFCWFKYLPVKILETLGTYSFPLYLLQYFFIFPLYFLLESFSLRGDVIVPCTFIAGISGPLLLVFYLFPHSRILTLLFSGLERFKRA